MLNKNMELTSFIYFYCGEFLGEFVLVRTDVPNLKLDVQGRFEQVAPNIYGKVMATQLTSVVAAGNSSATIEVRLRPQHAQWRYRLDVLANGKRVFFDRKSLKVQHFPGTVYLIVHLIVINSSSKSFMNDFYVNRSYCVHSYVYFKSV